MFILPARGADLLKPGLARAGIPYRDGVGLVFDFHSLRRECATLADQAGSSPRVVQALMRHRTLELTGRYTRPRAHDLNAATAGRPRNRGRAANRNGRNRRSYENAPCPFLAHRRGRNGADRVGRRRT